jgi:AmpD protein
MKFTIKGGLVEQAHQVPSPNFDERPSAQQISLLVIHSISLPPGEFGGPWIDALFTNTLDLDVHPYFREHCNVEVSAHILIRRTGEIIQYVPLEQRAWHAGQSEFQGTPRCNDFSIGIELEGYDDTPFEDIQYETLTSLTRAILANYPAITQERIVGHCDIAPGRKTDPGPLFDWLRFRELIQHSNFNQTSLDENFNKA